MATKPYIWVPAWMCAMIKFCMNFKSSWYVIRGNDLGIPSFMSHLLNRYPDIHHVPPFAGLLSQTSTFWPWPRMEISNLTLGRKNKRIFQAKLLLPWVRDKKKKERKRERKRINQSKIEEKQNKINREGGVLWTKQCLNNVQNCWKRKYKRRAIVTWLKPGGCVQWSPALVTNQIFVSALVPCRTKEKRKHTRERPEQPKPNFLPKSNLIKSYWSMMIVHIIFHLMENDLQSQSMTYLWFGIKMKHLPVWNFIHLEQFSSIQLDPVFLLMLF